MNVLAINFSPSRFIRQKLLDFFDSRFEIRNWLGVNESLVLVVSTVGATELSDTINARFPDLTFMVFLVEPEKVNGRESGNVWEFINEPSDSGHWPPL